jgi:hypothetical protein
MSAFATDIFPKLQTDISERINLLRFANLPPKFSNRARPESRRFASRFGHGALAFLTLNPPTTGGLSELRDKFLELSNVVFHVGVSRIFVLPSSRILSTLRFPTACVSCHILVQAMRGAFESVSVDMSDEAGLLHLLTTWLDAAEMLRSITLLVSDGPCGDHLRVSRRTRGWRRVSYGSHDVSITPQRQRQPPC